MRASIKTSLLYFLAVFSAGFALGVLRVLFLVDAIGERRAELTEIPIMAIICAMAARYFVTKSITDLTLSGAVTVGVAALIMLLVFEFTLVLGLREISIDEYIANRDPISGIAYLIGLAWYAIAPPYFYMRNSVSSA